MNVQQTGTSFLRVVIMVFGFITAYIYIQSVPIYITTNAVSSNPAQATSTRNTIII